MRKTKIFEFGTATVLMISIVVSMLSGTAYAITGNYMKDESKHPYVCLVVFYDAAGEPLWRTTGSLLSSKIVLTAGHGTDGAKSASIWIEEGPIAYNPPNHYPYGHNAESYDGIPYTMPGFGYYVDNNGLVGFIKNDAGIVVLSEEVPTDKVSTYADLPQLGVVNSLPVGTDVTFVGYGVQYQITPRNDGGPYEAWRGLRERFYASAKLLSKDFAISSSFLKCSGNAARGKGGTAFGDSGGPVLKGDTNTILAITSFGANSNCAGVGYYYRIDQTDVLKWIDGFLP